MRYDLISRALLAVLRAQTDDDGNPLSIGDGKAPEPPDGEVVPDTPYAVLRRIHGGRDQGVMADPHAHLYVVFEVRSVSWSPETTERMATAMRDAIVGRSAGGYTNAIAGAGWGVARRDHITTGDVSLEGTLWNTADDFGLLCVPV